MTTRPTPPCPKCESPMRTIYNCNAPPFGVLHRCRPCGYRLTVDAWQRLWEERKAKDKTRQ